jgi:hypothetical protein
MPATLTKAASSLARKTNMLATSESVASRPGSVFFASDAISVNLGRILI